VLDFKVNLAFGAIIRKRAGCVNKPLTYIYGKFGLWGAGRILMSEVKEKGARWGALVCLAPVATF
jgi:hypothetical protein